MLSAISTVVAVLVFRRFCDWTLIGRATNRILAHLMELGLFFDEPLLVLRAHRDLLRENLRLLRLIILPCVLLAIPFALFFAGLNSMFGRAPWSSARPPLLRSNGPALRQHRSWRRRRESRSKHRRSEASFRRKSVGESVP